jgi:hypothetical protein
MRNWHISVIKLDKARVLLSENKIEQKGDPNIYIGVIEGSIEYIAKDIKKPISENNNYISPNQALNNGDDERKIIYRKRIDSIFYDENLTIDDNKKLPSTHATSVAGIIAGKENTPLRKVFR